MAITVHCDIVSADGEVYQQSGWTENRDIRIFVLTKAPGACKSGEATSGNLEYYDI